MVQRRRPFDNATLVGRDREIGQLRASLDAMLAGRGHLVLVSGEAGIGKTVLVEDLALEAAHNGVVVLTGHGFDLTAIPPYGVWTELFATYHTPEDTTLTAPGPLHTGNEAPALQSRPLFFEQVRSFLVAAAELDPLLLILEDVHWSDAASLELLRFLARQLSDYRILFVVTYRDDELSRTHPLFQLLPLLVSEARADRLHLQPLSAEGTADLVTGAYGLSPADEERLVAYLKQHAEGNPLYVLEFLRTLEEDQVLVQAGEQWTLGDLQRTIVPSLIQQVIERRLARLDPDARRLLEIGAVVGQELPLYLWTLVAEITEEQLLDSVEQALVAHLLEETPDGAELRFPHELVRHTLYSGIALPRRRIWHRRIAEALNERAPSNPDLVAYHFQQADDPRAVEWLIKSGDRAVRAFTWTTAVERYEAAERLLERDETNDRERGWMLRRIGILLQEIEPSKAIPYHERALQLAHLSGDRVLAAYVQAELGLAHCLAGNLRRGLRELRRGDAALADLPPGYLLHDDIVARWEPDFLPTSADQVPPPVIDTGAAPVSVRRGLVVGWLAITGQVAEAIRLGEPYVEWLLAQPELPLNLVYALADALGGLAIAYAIQGRPEEARRAFARTIEIWEQTTYHTMIERMVRHELRTTSVPYMTTDIEARRRLELLAEGAFARGSQSWQAGHPSSLMIAFLEGRWAEAREQAVAQRGQWTEIEESLVVVVLALLDWHQGEHQAAWNEIATVLVDGPQTQPGASDFLAATALQRIAAHLALDAGDSETAGQWLEAHDRWLEWSGALLGRADGEILRARYHHGSGDLPRARQHADRALVLALEPHQPLAVIAIQRFLGQLAIEEGRFDEAEAHLTASLDLARLCQAPYEQALTLLDLARLRVRAHDNDRAGGLLDSARANCMNLQAMPVLDQVAALEAQLAHPAQGRNPAGLTGRELDVLRLVAQGLTDAEVAERLYIGRRTVSWHLTSIYGKLGVSSRAAATRFAVEEGLT